MPHRAMSSTLLILAAVAALTSGCAGQQPPPPPPAAPPAPAEPPAPTSSPAPATPVAAADGSNLAACFDGACEVRIAGPTAIRLNRRFGLPTFRVTAIEQSAVSMESSVVGGGSFSTDDCAQSDQCSVSMTSGSGNEPGHITLLLPAGGVSTLRNLQVRVIAVDSAGAVLRFTAH
jgi:hypothetical protein